MKELVTICGVPHKIKYCEDTFNVDTHFGQIAAQNAWNAAQTANIQNIQNILGQVVKPFVPNYALSPGYGFAQVFAAPEVATASSAG